MKLKSWFEVSQSIFLQSRWECRTRWSQHSRDVVLKRLKLPHEYCFSLHDRINDLRRAPYILFWKDLTTCCKKEHTLSISLSLASFLAIIFSADSFLLSYSRVPAASSIIDRICNKTYMETFIFFIKLIYVQCYHTIWLSILERRTANMTKYHKVHFATKYFTVMLWHLYGMVRGESMTIKFVLLCVVMYCIICGGHNFMWRQLCMSGCCIWHLVGT